MREYRRKRPKKEVREAINQTNTNIEAARKLRRTVIQRCQIVLAGTVGACLAVLVLMGIADSSVVEGEQVEIIGRTTLWVFGLSLALLMSLVTVLWVLQIRASRIEEEMHKQFLG